MFSNDSFEEIGGSIMDSFWFDLGVSALLRVLQNRKEVQKYLSAIAKVYLAIEQAAHRVPDLAAAIEKKRSAA